MKPRATGFSVMLLLTMALSTMGFFSLAVAAAEIQDEFSIGAVEIGLLGALNTGVGALFAPAAGRLSDRLGGRTAVALTLITSGLTAVWAAVSGSYFMLALASTAAGIPQGLGNPACNKAIAAGVESERKGIFAGIKQSGVQTGVFAAGFLVPWMTSQYGWRSAMWLIAALSAVSLLGLPLVTERESDPNEQRSAAEAASSRLPAFVTQVAIFGFLLGLVGGGLGRFLPLFAEDEVGFSFTDAGRVFGLQGLVAIPCRLLAGVALDRGAPARAMLIGAGLVGTLSVGLILGALHTPWLLWAGTILGGMSLGAWNTPANLAMIRQPNAGRATGRLMLGFLIGLTVGGPLVGASIDIFERYEPAWVVSAVLALAGAIVMLPKMTGEVEISER